VLAPSKLETILDPATEIGCAMVEISRPNSGMCLPRNVKPDYEGAADFLFATPGPTNTRPVNRRREALESEYSRRLAADNMRHWREHMRRLQRLDQHQELEGCEQ
jgi:hypothetical protein